MDEINMDETKRYLCRDKDGNEHIVIFREDKICEACNSSGVWVIEDDEAAGLCERHLKPYFEQEWTTCKEIKK